MELGPIQKKWMAELKAHPERQLKGQLSNDEGTKMCCLGQALCILKDITIGSGKLRDDDNAAFLEGETFEALGLRSGVGHLRSPYCGLSTLAALNDDSGMTWPEIADYIEANPDNVFTKSV